MKFKDYYQTLGIDKDATQEEIKRAYRKLARRYHPDVSKDTDAEERFKELGEAYEVLKDPEKRAAYDQLGANWQAGQDFTAPPDWDAGFEFSGGGFTQADGQAFSDFFESLFGRGFDPGTQRKRQPFSSRGADHHAKILIDLEDSLRGATRSLTLQVPGVDARGHLRTRDHTLKVTIPKGIAPGQRIRLAGQGEPGYGGAPAGDLYLDVAFRPHSLYRLEGKDIYLDLPVAPWEVALGATVEVPTPVGKVDLKIPAGSVGGKKMRIKGRGLPARGAGDFYAVLKIVVPPASSPQVEQAYRELAEASGFDPRRHLHFS